MTGGRILQINGIEPAISVRPNIFYCKRCHSRKITIVKPLPSDRRQMHSACQETVATDKPKLSPSMPTRLNEIWWFDSKLHAGRRVLLRVASTLQENLNRSPLKTVFVYSINVPLRSKVCPSRAATGLNLGILRSRSSSGVDRRISITCFMLATGSPESASKSSKKEPSKSWVMRPPAKLQSEIPMSENHWVIVDEAKSAHLDQPFIF